jgi:hypothetical protein
MSLVLNAIDIRKGGAGLYGRVGNHLGEDTRLGRLFISTNSQRTRLRP